MKDEQPFNKYVFSWEGEVPILFEMPHSGHTGEGSPQGVPACIAKKIRYDSPKVRDTIGFGCDAAVPVMSAFYSHSNRYKLNALFNGLARTYCDTNRTKSEVSNWAVVGGVEDDHHSGIIWDRTLLFGAELYMGKESLEAEVREKCEKMFSKPLVEYEFNELMAEVYDVYHERIRRFHRTITEKYGYCIHLALHSLPAFQVTKVSGGYVMGDRVTRGPFGQTTLPDIILIHNNYKAADKVLVDKVRSAFEEHGLIVEDGQGPFVGDIGVTKIYGDPRKGINVIGIEHVSHDTEPERHLGNPIVNYQKSLEYQPAYRQAVLNLLK